MRCTSLAMWLATPLLLACSSSAFTYPPDEFTWGWNNGRSCGAKITAIFNQHGPLFNYGPYYGYPPFEPYGPWNAYLQYNPWYYGSPNDRGGWAGCPDRDLSGHGPLCSSCGPSWHSSWFHGGWYHGCSTCGCGGIYTSCGSPTHGSTAPCKTCGITGSVSDIGTLPKPAFAPGTDPVARCSGMGNTADFAEFYAGLPALDLSTVQAGGPAK